MTPVVLIENKETIRITTDKDFKENKVLTWTYCTIDYSRKILGTYSP